MNIEQLFFQLLQVAIGTRNKLDRQPTSKEWTLLFELSNKHALTAIAFTGVTRLNVASDFGASQGIPETVYLKWLGLMAKVAQRNKEVSAACVELVKQYTHDGLACCVLKGQGILEYYQTLSSSPLKGEGLDADLSLCRTPGDIDIWVKPMDESGIDIAVADLDGKGAHYQRYHGKEAVIEYVKMLHRIAGSEPHEGVRYHHIDAPSVNGVDVEAHFRPLFLDSPLRNWRLQRWFRLNEQFGLHDAKIGNVVLPVPTTSFNAVYQLCHIYGHLFDEGSGLRYVLDCY